MAIKTCATPMGRALAGVLSFLIIGVASNSISYAYTVDDLREFTGFGRKDTLENKGDLNIIKCSNCGASVDVLKGECEYCHTVIKVIQEWVIDE